MQRNGYGSAELLELNAREINWDAPRHPRCTHCQTTLGCAPPGSGSYASTLDQFEALLGPFGERIPGLRLLILFDEPRDSRRAARFEAVAPDVAPTEIPPGMHRYFFLSHTAWRAQELHVATGSPDPCWPTRDTAAHYLETYLRYRPSRWSYDAFLAYVFSVIRPEFGYVTNLAKCHFGADYDRPRMQELCAGHVLARELELIRPNLVISMSRGAATAGQLCRMSGYSEPITLLRWHHTAARGGARRKLEKILRSVRDAEPDLERVGVSPVRLSATLSQHAEPSLRQPL